MHRQRFSFFFLLTFWAFSSLNAQAFPLQGVVVSEDKLASEVGVRILANGGNAIDAAVAVAYALAVVNPCCGNIGGGGFLLIHLANGKNVFINFREKAPLLATSSMFLNESSNSDAATKGFRAVAVPGTVLGLDTALREYGTFSLQKVIAPAVKLAKDGFILRSYDASQLETFAPDFKTQPNVAAIFLNKGKPFQPGSLLRQTDLGKTLKQISSQGSKAFYSGDISKKIVAASEAQGGILSLRDFKTYTVKKQEPLYCHYHGYTIVSAPPPSSGGALLCEMLNILELFPIKTWGRTSEKTNQVILEAMRYAFNDRNQLGDPDFIDNPVQKLISKPYAQKIKQKIQNTDTLPKTPSHPIRELTDTTHLSVLDRWGNAASLTYTLNGFFGAGVIADQTGFFLNNIMDDFETQPGVPNKFGLVQSANNAIAPGKRPLSSMTPTIVLKNGKIVLVLGSPGGPRIITAILLTLINFLDFHLSLQEAVDTSRFHFQAQPDVVDMEPGAFTESTKAYLEKKGYHLKEQTHWGAIEAIYVSPTGEVSGANDKRRPNGGVAKY